MTTHSGYTRPTRSRLGPMQPSCAPLPLGPDGSAKFQIGAWAKLRTAPSSGACFRAASPYCSHLSHQAISSRGRRLCTKSPAAGILPYHPSFSVAWSMSDPFWSLAPGAGKPLHFGKMERTFHAAGRDLKHNLAAIEVESRDGDLGRGPPAQLRL